MTVTLMTVVVPGMPNRAVADGAVVGAALRGIGTGAMPGGLGDAAVADNAGIDPRVVAGALAMGRAEALGVTRAVLRLFAVRPAVRVWTPATAPATSSRRAIKVRLVGWAS
jgi:hypothetical protein